MCSICSKIKFSQYRHVLQISSTLHNRMKKGKGAKEQEFVEVLYICLLTNSISSLFLEKNITDVKICANMPYYSTPFYFCYFKHLYE
jgi:hypothetical protein